MGPADSWGLALATLSVLLGYAESSRDRHVHLKKIEVFIPTAKGNLTCHECYYGVHGNNCLTMRSQYRLDRQLCAADQKYCMVERFHTDGEMTTFTRSCARTCQDGCVSTPGSYKLQYCYKCCRKNFCNIGDVWSAAARSRTVVTSLLTCLLASMASWKS